MDDKNRKHKRYESAHPMFVNCHLLEDDKEIQQHSDTQYSAKYSWDEESKFYSRPKGLMIALTLSGTQEIHRCESREYLPQVLIRRWNASYPSSTDGGSLWR